MAWEGGIAGCSAVAGGGMGRRARWGSGEVGGDGREPNGTWAVEPGGPDFRGCRGWQGLDRPNGNTWGWWGRRRVTGGQEFKMGAARGQIRE